MYIFVGHLMLLHFAPPWLSHQKSLLGWIAKGGHTGFGMQPPLPLQKRSLTRMGSHNPEISLLEMDGHGFFCVLILDFWTSQSIQSAAQPFGRRHAKE